jgi:hypothetical protein
MKYAYKSKLFKFKLFKFKLLMAKGGKDGSEPTANKDPRFRTEPITLRPEPNLIPKLKRKARMELCQPTPLAAGNARRQGGGAPRPGPLLFRKILERPLLKGDYIVRRAKP